MLVEFEQHQEQQTFIAAVQPEMPRLAGAIEEESRPVTPNEYIAELPGVFHDLNFDSYPYLFQVIGISDDSIQLFFLKIYKICSRQAIRVILAVERFVFLRF